MNYRELYAELSQHELRNVAARARLSVEDVRQEAWLLCLRVVRGDSDYRPALGSVRQYVMGRLWGLTLRWQAPVLFGHGADPDDAEVHVPGDAPWERALMERSPYAPDPGAADPLHVLMAREEDQAYRVACAQTLDDWVATGQLTPGEQTFVELILGGTPVMQIADLYGLTPRAVCYRCERLRNQMASIRDPNTALAVCADGTTVCRGVE